MQVKISLKINKSKKKTQNMLKNNGINLKRLKISEKKRKIYSYKYF